MNTATAMAAHMSPRLNVVSACVADPASTLFV